jgi:hypothetical protein
MRDIMLIGLLLNFSNHGGWHQKRRPMEITSRAAGAWLISAAVVLHNSLHRVKCDRLKSFEIFNVIGFAERIADA